jgi:hypothetical protein
MDTVRDWVLVALAAVLSCVAGDGDFDCFVINLAGNIKDYRQTFVIGTGTNALPSLTEYTYASNTQSTPWFGINMGNGAVSAASRAFLMRFNIFPAA